MPDPIPPRNSAMAVAASALQAQQSRMRIIAENIANAQFQVSMPASIDAFVQQRLPEATRIELCYTPQHIVVRRGWEPLAPGCQPGAEDTVTQLVSDTNHATAASANMPTAPSGTLH